MAIRNPRFDAWNTVILLGTLQELRGLFAHYANCNQVWGTLERPVDALLAYPYESSFWVRCGGAEFQQPFWNMIGFLRHVMGNRVACGNLSAFSLFGLLPGPVRMCGPTIRGRIFWFSGDATLARVSCVIWSERDFICCPVSDLMVPFTPRHQKSSVMADIELLPIIISIAVWGIPGGGAVHIDVTDNTNAMSRANRKRSKRGISSRLLETFLAWGAHFR